MKAPLPLLLLAFILTACKDTPVAPEPAPHHEVIYTRQGSGTPVVIMRALSDGSEKRVVLEGNLIAAPVKGRILFLGQEGQDLYTGFIDGGPSIKIDSGDSFASRFQSAAISPDGNQFLSVEKNISGGNVELSIRNMDGSGRQLLASTLFANSRGTFSHDGRKIAFLGADGRLFTINIDGTGLTALTSPPSSTRRAKTGIGLTPEWSPNGEWIAMESFITETIDIIGAANGHPDTLPSFRGEFPIWSPDGRDIACTDGAWIVVHSIDGTTNGITSETYGASSNYPAFPRWSPDQRRLLPQMADYSKLKVLRSIDIASRTVIFIDNYTINAYWL